MFLQKCNAHIHTPLPQQTMSVPVYAGPKRHSSFCALYIKPSPKHSLWKETTSLYMETRIRNPKLLVNCSYELLNGGNLKAVYLGQEQVSPQAVPESYGHSLTHTPISHLPNPYISMASGKILAWFIQAIISPFSCAFFPPSSITRELCTYNHIPVCVILPPPKKKK